MNSTVVSLADAKAHLSELTDKAARGETVIITKRGKPVVQMSPPDKPRRPIDLAALQRLTADQPMQPQPAGEFVRAMRDQTRY